MLPAQKKCVVRIIDRLCMTIVADWYVEQQIMQKLYNLLS